MAGRAAGIGLANNKSSLDMKSRSAGMTESQKHKEVEQDSNDNTFLDEGNFHQIKYTCIFY